MGGQLDASQFPSTVYTDANVFSIRMPLLTGSSRSLLPPQARNLNKASTVSLTCNYFCC